MIDINLIKQKLGEQKNSSKGQSPYIWKPKSGQQIIRIVPYKFNKDNPFIELYFHYSIAKSMLSPVSYGRPDPAAKMAEKLLQKNDKDAYKLSKQIEPKLRVYVPILERGKEKDGVKFWGISRSIYTELLEYIADPEWGDITDLSTGNDIKVTFKDAKEMGNDFGEVTIRLARNKTPLCANSEELAAIFETQQDITTIFKEPSYDELQTILDEYIRDYKKDSDKSSGDGFAAPKTQKPSVKEEFNMDEFAAPKTPAPTVSETSVTSKESVNADPDDINAQFDALYGAKK